MAHLLRSYPNTSLKFCTESSYGYTLIKKRASGVDPILSKESHFGYSKIKAINFQVKNCTTTSTPSAERGGLVENERSSVNGSKPEFEYLANEYGWKVRRLAENGVEMREAARVQSQAFHEPSFLFNDFFFEFFQAEVLAGLVYKLRNSPQNRYACLVAEAATDISNSKRQQLVGVVDVTVLRDQNVLEHLPFDAEEYLYVSGIAVLENFRRKKIGSVLLKACDMVSMLWGFKYLVLRAYEDDYGARQLYSNAGYTVVSGDPPWLTTWIGRKRRVLMVKRSNLPT